MSWFLLKNSLLVAGLATLAALLLGGLSALWVRGLGGRGRAWAVGLALLPLVLPPFLLTSGWLWWLEAGARWRWSGLGAESYALAGTVWVLALLTWPITLVLLLSAWSRLELGCLEADPFLRGAALVRRLLLPQAAPELAVAAVVTLVLCLNNFSVPALLQTRVYPVEVWLRFNTAFDHAGALRASWPLILAPLLLIICLSRAHIPWPRFGEAAPARQFRRQLGWGYWVCGAVFALVLGLSVGMPLGRMLGSAGTWLELGPAARVSRAALANSAAYAGVAATACMGLALATWRWPMGSALWLPFLAPGVLLGIGLITVFNRPGLTALYQSAAIVWIALVIRYAAIGWNLAAGAMRTLDRELVDAARLEGARGWRLFRLACWPQVDRQLAAAWYLTYLFMLWDVETLLLIIPPGGESIAVRIFNLLHYGHIAQVHSLCLLLLAVALLPGLLWVLARFLIRTAGAGIFFRSGTAAFLAGCVALGAGCGEEPMDGAVGRASRIFERVEVIGGRGAGMGQFNKPRSVAVDARDYLYVVDMTGRVQKFSPAGEVVGLWQMPQTEKGRPKGMALDHLGNVMLIEPHYARVNHFSADGALVAQWGASGTRSGQLSFPRAVAVNESGEIYISEYGLVERVQCFAPLGREHRLSFGTGGGGHGQFNRAEGLGIDRNGRVYVADSCNHRIQVFSGRGEFLRQYGRPGDGPGELSYPYDVRVDGLGRQYVCEFGNSRIQIFDAQDRPIEVLGGPGSAPGRFANPWSIALDSKGNLYVADSANHRVQKFVAR